MALDDLMTLQIPELENKPAFIVLSDQAAAADDKLLLCKGSTVKAVLWLAGMKKFGNSYSVLIPEVSLPVKYSVTSQ